MQRLVLVLVLAGCPAPSRYVVADVTAARAPLSGALVAADCGGYANAAQRTDEDGRARVRVVDTNACSLLIAKPGYPTVQTGPVSVCPAGACAPTRIDLSPGAGLAPTPVEHPARVDGSPGRAPTHIELSRPSPSGRRPLEVAQ